LALAAWGCALLSLAPALPLVHQARPYMAYLAAAAAVLTVAAWLPARWCRRRELALVLVIGAVIWGQVNMRVRIGRLASDGLPADPVVRAAQQARGAAGEILGLLPERSSPLHLVIYQPDLAGRGERDVVKTGRPAIETPRYVALAGALGVSLLLEARDDVTWTSSLLAAPDDAFVICEKEGGFQAWGTTYDALLYAAQLHVVTVNHRAAVDHLARAWSSQRTRRLQVPAANVLGFPAAALARPAQAFDGWLGTLSRDGQLTSVEYARYHEFLGEPGPRQRAGVGL
jgi:hypothetical protein